MAYQKELASINFLIVRSRLLLIIANYDVYEKETENTLICFNAT